MVSFVVVVNNPLLPGITVVTNTVQIRDNGAQGP